MLYIRAGKKRGMLKWKTTIEKLNTHQKLLPVGYMSFAAISFCGMVRFLTPWIWENKCFSEPYPSAILMAFRRTRIAVGYLTRPGKQIKLNIERKQRERPFEKSACAHLIMPTNVHLHVLRFASFSAFVFYKRKIRNRETNTTGNDQKEEKPWRTKKSTASGNLKKSYRILLKRICRWDRNFCSWRKLFGRRRTKEGTFFCCALSDAESDGLQRLQNQKKRTKTILFSMSDIS